MSLNKLNQLYMAVVIDHASHPHHKLALPDATTSVELHNVSCGDDIRAFILMKDDKVQQVSFTGNGCTISQASASMMTDALAGLTKTEAVAGCEAFFQLVMGKQISTKAKAWLGYAEILGSVAEFPARIKCATLAWHAAQEALEGGN
ncbi:Fe-S cluster assembly sulfur transfer protein SufU [Pediococcus parvulus]|uniref:Fe-S cluster assembly sulfur transfer protein SufU n=1 Tax=Pediococcus parvulus TaxID=54062 RepID=UPI003D06F692